MPAQERTGAEAGEALAALRRGDASAMDRLIAIVYDDLRYRARRQLARGPRHDTLSTTALVHEAYLRLVDAAPAGWESLDHFFGVVVKAMRSVVVDYARRRSAKKRGGLRIELTDGMLQTEDDTVDVLAMDEGLRRLAEVDGRLCDLVELRFFGGLSVEETAQILKVSDRTIKRDWRKARALLHQLLHEG